MNYIEKLHPWCIVRHFPNMQNSVVARFRRRNDAEAHLQALDLIAKFLGIKRSLIIKAQRWAYQLPKTRFLD